MDVEAERFLLQTEQALQAFYHGANAAETQTAHKCLLNLQNSSQAWQVCWKLLDTSKSVESQYFGATMLHYKITKHWKELPEEHHMPLKDEIIKYICIFSKGAKMVLSKLCIALAAFILQVVPKDWPDGCELVINEMERNLSSSASDGDDTITPRFVMLEYLTVLPEEFNSGIITGTHRTAIREQLAKLVPKVLEMLYSVFASSHTTVVYSSSIKCLSSWIQFGASILDCQKLLPTILVKLNDPNLIDVVASLLVELLSHPSSFKHENSVYSFLENVDGFEAILRKAIQEEDSETVTSICKVLVSIGETHTNLLRQASTDDQQKNCLKLIHLILLCTGIQGSYPIDETCSELTFSFWYTLQDELLTVDPKNITNYYHYMRASYVTLIEILFRKVQLPDDSLYADYTADEKEMLRCYRQDIQDTIMYVYSLLREQCLHNLTEMFKFLVSAQQTSKWQGIEAVLFLLQGTSECIDTNESNYIKTIISLLPSLPSHPKVIESAVYMIGSFSEWLACHPDQLGMVLPLLQNGINQVQLRAACTLSLRDICRETSRSLSQNISSEVVSTCLNAIKSNQLNDKQQMRCVESIGYVLAGLSHDSRQERQKEITTFLIEMLVSSFKFSQLDASGIVRVQHAVSCFSAFFRSSDACDEQNANIHPLLPCFIEFIKAIQIVVFAGITDAVAQEITNAIHKAVDSIRDPFFNVLPETSAVIFEIFGKIPSGLILEMCATIVGMLGNVAEAQGQLKTFFERLVIETINSIENGKSKDNPDVVHGFLILLNRTVKSTPRILFENKELHVKSIQCALNSLGCPETPTVKAATNFFASYITAAATSNENEAAKMLELFGQDLVNRILTCIGGLTPRSNVDLFAIVLTYLNRNFISKVAEWLNNALSQHDFPSKIVTSAQKENFKKTVLRERVNKRKLKEIVQEFSLVCRGLHGMAYTS